MEKQWRHGESGRRQVGRNARRQKPVCRVADPATKNMSFENIFEFQLENYASKGDVLFVFSCSGTSKNILKVIKKANKLKIETIFISGFLKKKLNAKVKLHYDLDCENYGITEDMFSSFMHLISQWIRFKYSNYNKKIIL